MRNKLLLLLAIVVGGLAGSWLKNLPGFVVIAIGTTTYEMRLWIAVALILLLILVLLLGIYFLALSLRGVNLLKHWSGKRSYRSARRKTIKGMLAFTEGRWAQAERAMLKAASQSDMPLINYLVAAQAAQHQGAEIRRDEYLKLAYEAEPSAEVTVGITQAQLQMQNNQFEQALATLSDLQSKYPSHPYLLKLLARCYWQLGEWQALIELLPKLKKLKINWQQSMPQLEKKVVAGVLAQAADDDYEALIKAWQALPSATRKLESSLLAYAENLLKVNRIEEAESLLRQILRKNPSEQAIKLYAELRSPNPQAQFNFLENWQQSHEFSPAIVGFALGRLARRAGFWGKAEQYLRRAIEANPSADAYWLLADALRRAGKVDEARQVIDEGLAVIAGRQEEKLPKTSATREAS